MYFPFLSPFRGWTCWKELVPWRRRPAGWKLRLSTWRLRGWGKVEAVVAGSVAEGFYGLLRGTMSHPSISSASHPHKNVHHVPVLPPSPICPLRSPQDLKSPILLMRQWSLPLQKVLPASKEDNPCQHATPLYSAGGHQAGAYRCQVEGCKKGSINLTWATICVHVCKVNLGVGLVCPSCSKSFFNPDTFWHHKKGHVNL